VLILVRRLSEILGYVFERDFDNAKEALGSLTNDIIEKRAQADRARGRIWANQAQSWLGRPASAAEEQARARQEAIDLLERQKRERDAIEGRQQSLILVAQTEKAAKREYDSMQISELEYYRQLEGINKERLDKELELIEARRVSTPTIEQSKLDTEALQARKDYEDRQEELRIKKLRAGPFAQTKEFVGDNLRRDQYGNATGMLDQFKALDTFIKGTLQTTFNGIPRALGDGSLGR
ncbi:MAG: hypothetical protein WC718_19320, partial [Phycisphaerales bacterium]